ncbi:MAG TPA: hypothetical protein DCX02_04460 [Firmicutes bacterium]|nr:hypothetical protein [Bacillota bacterium]
MHLLSQGLPFVDDGCMLTLVAPDLDLEPLYVIKPLRVVEQGRSGGEVLPVHLREFSDIGIRDVRGDDAPVEAA